MGSLSRRLAPLLVVAGLLGLGQVDDALAAPPSNDNLIAATQVFLGGSSGTTTTEATTEAGEPVPSCVGSASKSVWFKYPAAESLTVIFDTTLTSFDTVMAVYTGPQNAATFASLTSVACNDNFGTNQGSRLSLPVTSGTWYYVQVAGVGAAFGDFFLGLGEFVPNDNLADAIPITTPPVPGQVAEGSTIMATAETGENAPSCGNSTASVWYSWTSPSTPGHVVFDTWGSSFDTVLAVYTGGPHPLTQVACSDEYEYWDAPGPSLTPVFYSGATTFYIQITAYCSGFGCITGGGGGYALNMSLGSTLIVTATDDTNSQGLGLNLREAMLMTQGALGRLPHPEEDQLTALGITAGLGSSDLVHLDFRCGGIFCIGPTGINLGSTLPTLAGTGDVISNKGRSVLVNGQDLSFTCFNVSGNSNRIEGLGITGCAGGVAQAGVWVSGSNNIIGGADPGTGNNIHGNYAGVWLVGPGTGNRVIGNEIGIGWLGADANAVGVYLSGSANYVGGTAPREGNVLSGNTYHGVYAYGSTNNTIQGNLIGTNPEGTSAMPNGLTGIWLSNSTGNTMGGDTAGARNVISGNNGPGVWISELNQVSSTGIGFGTVNVPITIPSGGAITDLNVNVDITHSTTGNLSISLLSPLGTIVDLSSGNGGSGDNYTRTIFDDEAATAITAGAPPFTGTFRPEVALSAFDGQLPGGVWTLRFQDTSFGFGFLNSASLHFAAAGGVNNTLKGNYIGTDIGGTASLPNASHGIKIENSHHNLIGGAATSDGNLIANNGGDGVYVGTDAASNTIRRDSIHTNTGLGINNDLGGNGGLAPPVITVTGFPGGTACANCTVDVYSDDSSEGRTYEGTVTANGAGNWQLLVLPSGPNVLATATDASGNTSEFSSPLCVDYDFDGVCAGDNCPKWANAAQNLPLWTVPADDADCDGFNATVEAHVGTDPALHCSANSTPNNEVVDAWPTDFNDSRLTSLADVVLMGPVYNQSTGSDAAKKRFDLNASGTVSLADVVLMGPFYNKGCG